MGVAVADTEPTFDLPSGSASDFYFSREINDREDDNNGKIVRKHNQWRYPFLTRRTGDNLAGTNDEITSSEFRHGRTASKTKLGNASSAGGLDFEFSPDTFDDQLEGVFRDKWIKWTHDGQKNGIAKDYITPLGYIHVNGDDGTYNQWYDESEAGRRVTQVPLLYTGNEAGTKEEPFGLIKVSEDKIGGRAKNPLGKFIAHELHIGNTPVKYSALSRIPITDKTVRYQNYRHVEMGELNINVTVNAIVTGSFSMNGSNNPDYYTEVQETGKTRLADQMTDKKVMAVGTSEEFYSADYRDAAERFIAKAKATTKSTDTDQFTALDGFLYVNGHQLQFASDLTMDLNNNLQAIYAIFVKNAIANLSPSLAVTGNITAYFTDGEKDATGRKYGADDLKNLASQNKDTEIVFAFIDKEDPDVVYLFQIFKATISAPSETKDAENPISLDLPYTSFGEMAVRCLRLAIPKIREILIDADSVVDTLREITAGDANKVYLTLVPNVPLDSEEVLSETEGVFTSADYVDTENKNGLYVFNKAEVTIIDANGNSTEDGEAAFSEVKINKDGTISAALTLSEDLKEGDSVKVKVVVNDTPCEQSETVELNIPYMRFGDNWKKESYANSKLSLSAGDTLDVLTAAVNGGSTAEDFLFYKVNSGTVADDLKVSSSNDGVVSVEGTTITVSSTAESDSAATITITSKYDDTVFLAFDVKVLATSNGSSSSTDPSSSQTQAEIPTLTGLNATETVAEGDTLTLTVNASVNDGGTLSYQWYKDGTALTGETSATFTKDNVESGDAGTYKLVVTNTLDDSVKTAEVACEVTVE